MNDKTAEERREAMVNMDHHLAEAASEEREEGFFFRQRAKRKA